MTTVPPADLHRTTVPTDRVAFFFDPMCPYAYQTSIWMREVRDRCGVEVDWRFFSLEEINREPGKKHPWERDWSYGWSMMRVGALLKRQDPSLLDAWYAEIGAALHDRGEKPFLPDGARAAAQAIGVDPGVVDAAITDPTTTDAVRADHDHVVTAFGAHGVPTLVFADTHALFGPVVCPAPTGEAAVRLWDLVTGWCEFPYLYELRKPKTAADLAHIATSFAPYLTARQWRTIESPAD